MGQEVKEALIDYCLINMSGKTNKFFANNWFGETIIKKNRDKVRPSANITLDKFLRKTVISNIISLTKTKDIKPKKSSATNYGNHHLAVNNTVDVSKLV